MTTRKFGICEGCKSAVIATFLSPKSGLCKVCDARRLAAEVFVPKTISSDDMNTETPDFGYDFDTKIDVETGDVYETDDEGERLVVDTVSTSDDIKAQQRKSRKLDEMTTRWLAMREAELAVKSAADAARAAIIAKGNTNPTQFLANKTREANNLELRDIDDDVRAASEKQLNALIKLGWDIGDIRAMKLTIAEASRLLQRGPRWLTK